MSKAKPSCFHCKEDVYTGEKFSRLIDNEKALFCCPACLAITDTILENGLSDYYQHRESAAPVPIKGDYKLWDNKSLQDGFVYPAADDTQTDLAHAKLYIEGMHCTACAWLIEKTLNNLPGVEQARLDYGQERLDVDWDIEQMPLSEVMSHIANIGYSPHPYQEDQIKKIQSQSEKRMLKRLGITGLLMMQVGMLSLCLYFGEHLGISTEYKQLLRVFALLFSLPLLLFGAIPFISRAIVGLEHKYLGMDVNIAIAILGLFGSSAYAVISKQGEIYFDSVAMLCFFILLARYIEHKSRMRLRNHTAFLPRIAHLIKNQNIEDKPLAKINPSDSIRVLQGEVIPTDGFVIAGNSTVSESLLTGESKPISKTLNDKVLAGSQNHDGVLDIQVSSKTSDSLARNIERFLQRKNELKPKSVSLTNKLSHHFSLAIILLSLGTWAYWFYMDNPEAYWIALSVLVVSCPCALSLAAPTALSAIQSQLRKQGILIQNPSTIERLHQITDILFDKTGTLTAGQFSIKDCQNLSKYSQQELDHLASRLQSCSRHPISQAFNETLNIAADPQVFLHQGVEASIEKKRYRIGSIDFCQQWHSSVLPPKNVSTSSTAQSQWVGLCDEKNMLAWYLLEDDIREQAKEVVSDLNSRGLDLSLVSGDQKTQVIATAKHLGIENSFYLQSSFEKLERLETIQKGHHKALTIGDGVNDAPVLSKSYVSATFSNACDWVKNTADIIILDQSLNSLSLLFKASDRYHRILRQNFAWAIAYNIIAIPFAMQGYITPWMAALGMSASSIIVVLNSYRLSR